MIPASAARIALVAGLALVVTRAGPAGADDCHPALDPSKPQYIVGYGSLMQSFSKRMARSQTNSACVVP